jgi:S-adenosylmethionine-diacylglycerol 3-amino-3-carboxypropyl transferase
VSDSAPDAKVFDRIRYAQCWEDAALLEQGLEIGADDDVLSVLSGGCNSLALVLAGARSVTAVDLSLPQVAVAELKVAGIRTLEYDDFVGLVGARESGRRGDLYRAVRPALTEAVAEYWDAHGDVIEAGVLGSGKFEGYFRLFRERVLPLIHRRSVIDGLLQQRGLDAQRRYYAESWDTWRWRSVFRVFFGRRVMGWLGRDPSFFQYVEGGSVGEAILRRARHGMTEVPVETNHFLEFILSGRFSDLENTHRYLSEAGFAALKGGLVDRLRIVHADLWEHVPAQDEGAYSAFNLSDVFEYVSEGAYVDQLHALLRVSRPGARLAYWNMMVPRSRPESLADRLEPDPDRAAELHHGDRAFFYGNFNLERKKT